MHSPPLSLDSEEALTYTSRSALRNTPVFEN